MDEGYKYNRNRGSWLVVLLILFLLFGGVGIFAALQNTNNPTSILSPINSSNGSGGFVPGVGGGPVTDLTPTPASSPTNTPTPTPVSTTQTTY